MKYFRVKEEYDNYRRADGSILVRNELYTEKEIQKYKIPANRVISVEIKKNTTYFCFGARFCTDCGYHS